MKKIFFVSALAFGVSIAMAQPPSSGRVGSPDTIGAKNDALYAVDTLGGEKQVPNNPYYSRGEGRVPSDSTRDRYAQGGKSARDKAHTKQHAAKKDTTHVHYKTSKTVHKTHKHSAATKTKKETN